MFDNMMSSIKDKLGAIVYSVHVGSGLIDHNQ